MQNQPLNIHCQQLNSQKIQQIHLLYNKNGNLKRIRQQHPDKQHNVPALQIYRKEKL